MSSAHWIIPEELASIQRKGLLGTLDSVTPVVADFGAILVAKGSQHWGVEIKDEPGALIEKVDALLLRRDD